MYISSSNATLKCFIGSTFFSSCIWAQIVQTSQVLLVGRGFWGGEVVLTNIILRGNNEEVEYNNNLKKNLEIAFKVLVFNKIKVLKF